MFTLSFCFFFEHESTESHSKLPFGKSKKYPLNPLNPCSIKKLGG